MDQVRVREMIHQLAENRSMKCRKTLDVTKTEGMANPSGQAGGAPMLVLIR